MKNGSSDYSLKYNGQIVITINEDLDEILNDDYINTLYQIESYVEEQSKLINSLDKNSGNVTLDVFIDFLNNKTVRLGYDRPTVNEFKDGLLTDFDLENINVSLEDYQKKIKE